MSSVRWMPFMARRSCRLALRYALLLCLAGSAALSCAAAFDAADTVHQLIPDARQAGSGTLRWFGFHIYDARFFVGTQGFSANQITATPFALDIDYAHAFQGVKIAARGRKEMDAMGLVSPAQSAAWAAQLEKIYPDVQPGDHLIGVFVPGQGTSFYFNDKPIGQIPGDAFARAFFSVWLDPHTPAPALRSALLAGVDH